MSDKRPVNLDLGTFKHPLVSVISISHRISGVVLFVGLVFLFNLFDMSLEGELGFASAQTLLLEHSLAQFVTWGLLTALGFHFSAGMKHLVMDFGHGEELESANNAAKFVIGSTVVLAILAGVWVW
ncbi:succinate dehydrogenase, cytochrome b556 subunit [Oceanospirillaceae bacterium]|nr:succinate dehydrogenase, cytochrome b556 subunit [Oceanospirillaceae bacterium]MDA9279831.1 succinate dehydrogenase, cytochrome b556 subunit [bacterium]MBT5629463.1 succinate dehydrogenase, cytochrome b556 subunit [Oceanospirillaceae bacterium]MBT6102138.1 succinate dehydrogenase, cytochrome b556 subunit [Oceanospirillaceae bacterium]MBT7673382.1 succinate dehydrogenase, cytochrome b556 subunit [Oceanospirillaceae bacterium]